MPPSARASQSSVSPLLPLSLCHFFRLKAEATSNPKGLRSRPPAAQGAIELDDRHQFLLTQLREFQFALKQIPLRVEDGQVAVQPAAIAVRREPRRFAQRVDQPFLLAALLASLPVLGERIGDIAK